LWWTQVRLKIQNIKNWEQVYILNNVRLKKKSFQNNRYLNSIINSLSKKEKKIIELYENQLNIINNSIKIKSLTDFYPSKYINTSSDWKLYKVFIDFSNIKDYSENIKFRVSIECKFYYFDKDWNLKSTE